MHTSNLLVGAAGLIPALVAAQHPAMLKRGIDCAFATSPDRGATCESFAAGWGLSVEELQKLNPGVTCPNIDIARDYCVIGEVTGDPDPTPTTTSKISSTSTTSTTLKTTTSPTTTTGAPAPSNSPAMPGLADDCDKFYKVASGDTCDAIAKKNSITVAQFRSWNSLVDANCSNLWLDYYVCVHTPGAAAPPTTTTTTTTSKAPGPTNSGPQPQMPGIVANCKKFYKVKSGDGCEAIAKANGISLAQFLAYNTAVDSKCSNIWLDYYVCTGV
ncbi:LysM domain-containing protein [Apiospora marii]|uniref:LysM domain-containing protein n=1 Tax=Apiospora marii TaxID=335849 RepID=A0ABR1RIV9_9PEZI